MVSTNKTLALLDKTIEDKQDNSFRSHLGASVLGRECSRELWYIFRWATKTTFKARILRLFDRGDLEEKRFEGFFADMGVKVSTTTPKGKQYRVSDVYGHLGGSLDGLGKGIPDLPKQPFVFEFKTHGEKSFKDLVKNKVKKSKWEHYIQMQIYMLKKGLKWALYCAVNKNTDHIHLELVSLDKKLAQRFIDRGKYIIFSEEAPPRIHRNPRWFKCITCDQHAVCHTFTLPAINCRTCAHSTPEKDGDGVWSCQLAGKYKIAAKTITDKPEQGCTQHLFNPNMLNGVQLGSGSLEENWLNIKMPNGESIKHGPKFVNSEDIGKYYQNRKQED